MLEHLDKKKLHHAYLIEGVGDVILPQILEFVKDMEVIEIKLDTFKIDDARNLKSYESFKPIDKKAFVISTNSFLLEAQNAMLKMFEEPIENTHFFVIVPAVNTLLQTFVSRFYVISPKTVFGDEAKVAEQFIKMPLPSRINFIKELLAEPEEDSTEVGEDLSLDSTRAKAIKFLNTLEQTLHSNISKGLFDTSYFHHIFKVREFLRMPGSSTKTLMESVALVVPVL